MELQFDRISSNLPGVATIIFTPFFSLSASSLSVTPPTSNTCFINGIFSKNFPKISLICTANSLVGLIIIPPTSIFFHFSGRFYIHIVKIVNILIHNRYKNKLNTTCNISNNGIRKASVFPLPVTASAATSLPFNNNGIQAA